MADGENSSNPSNGAQTCSSARQERRLRFDQSAGASSAPSKEATLQKTAAANILKLDKVRPRANSSQLSSMGSARSYRSGKSSSRRGASEYSRLSTPLALLRELQELHPESPRTSNVIPTPWGPERANQDYPPHDKVVEKQRHYHELLDMQAAKDRKKKEERQAQQAAQDKTACTSWETSRHEWQANKKHFADMEKKIYQELVATAASHHQRAREERALERQDYAMWAQSAEKEHAELFALQRQRRREECADLAESWRRATEEKEQRKQAEKEASLQEEKQQVQRITRGMAAPRRMKRPPPTAW